MFEDKPMGFDHKQQVMGNIIDNAEQRRLKSKIIAGYSGKDNLDMEATIDSQLMRLI